MLWFKPYKSFQLSNIARLEENKHRLRERSFIVCGAASFVGARLGWLQIMVRMFSRNKDTLIEDR
jgi:hypothetical protein